MRPHRILLHIAFASLLLAGRADPRPGEVPRFGGYLAGFEQIPTPNFGIIQCILRDRRGFIWFGTTKGLCRYDGYQVRVLNNAGVSSDKIFALAGHGGDSLLLATGDGLWTFDVGTEKFGRFDAGAGLPEGRINAIAVDSNGTTWIGTDTKGVFGLRGETTPPIHLDTANGLSDNCVTTLLADRAGTLWIGTRVGGLIARDPRSGSMARYRSSAVDETSLWANHVLTLCEDGAGRIWVGTQGVNIVDGKSGSVRRIALPSNVRRAVRAIVFQPPSPGESPDGRVWIGVSDLGLLSFVGGKFEQFAPTEDATRALNSIHSIYVDPVAPPGGEFHLWIGTRQGVEKVFLRKNAFENSIRAPGGLELNRGAVLALCEDRDGVVWVGLWGGGLNGFRRTAEGYRRVHNFEHDPEDPGSLPDDAVNDLLEDAAGNLWIGTQKGLAVLDPGRKHLRTHVHRDDDTATLPSDVVARLSLDSSGALWVATSAGLSRLRPGPGDRFSNSLTDTVGTNTLGGSTVSDLLADAGGNLWAATYGRGLRRIGPDGTVTAFADPADTSGMETNFIYSLARDERGTLWLSTRVGLVSFDTAGSRFRRHSIDRLFGAYITGIEPDRQGTLWLSTGIGLTRYDPASGTLVRFDRRQGIPFEELFSRFWRSGGGRLMAGGIDGFTEFLPEGLAHSSLPPEIAITGFRVFDRDLTAWEWNSGRVFLSHDENYFSCSFAALDYTNPSQNRFAYRMDGVDERWIDAGTHNYASYTHLDPGSYVLRVKGCNDENVWNETGTSIAITITPPYWQTAWFRALAAVALIGALYAAYRYRLRSILEVERVRLRIADDLHDDVGSNLGTIALVSRSAARATELRPDTRRKLAEIYETAISTSEGMKDIVWFIKPKSDRLADVILRMRETAATLLGEIDYDFRTSGLDDSVRVSIDFKRNFFLAFKEILANAARHASAKRVVIDVRGRDGKVVISVRDDGAGFHPPPDGEDLRGNGLSSLRRRARALGGECEIVSSPGDGTTVTFSGLP